MTTKALRSRRASSRGLVHDLGDKRFLMLRNHGLLTVGRSVAEAFVAMYFFETTCMIQVRAMSGGQATAADQPGHRGAAPRRSGNR
jgi:ribulose-5-phosphate 4-epimerase/fuculose-1-phosphate aldolase